MSNAIDLGTLAAQFSRVPRYENDGFICSASINSIEVKGLERIAKVGDLVEIFPQGQKHCLGEILSLKEGRADVFSENGNEGLSLHDRVRHLGPAKIMPDTSWLGRVIDPFVRPLDGLPLTSGNRLMELKASAPSAKSRRSLGARICTGLAAVDTLFPFVRGQRMGIFAGSGVGKSTLLADFAKGVEADVTVIAMVGERGRELNEFIENTLGAEGMKKAVVVAATSDQPAMVRRRAAWTAMAIAEFFRDQGSHVLLLVDSITRFAEAHREVAATLGQAAGPNGFPPSTGPELMALCERAGPGQGNQGDISAIFSVLVEGSDMEGPIADTMRGVLDGHLVLSRTIAEQGRFPAIDVVKSLSRSIEIAASPKERTLISQVRSLATAYDEAKTMIQAGLYSHGSDALIDDAIAARSKLEKFLSRRGMKSVEESFTKLIEITPESEGQEPLL
ncbi:flagellum-specific ATP synthase [Litoreibacter ponti]|uniref:Flagellum-specific ATP synthase n=1 Tax=Litoreibacter ponti TaxID=1510457 RepID=A0A2T6BND2_9RHOB|nr:FliI/YscN family ATPase [Litoreibacter ponti]PTX57579.1 flagellum-specific ATP synthase [Litoreibacter ponti]